MVEFEETHEEWLALLAHQIDLLCLEFAQEAAAFAAVEDTTTRVLSGPSTGCAPTST